MSTALAIAGVTAVLRDLLDDGYINHETSAVLGTPIKVSVMPPDRVVPTNGSESSQVNLFLYQVTPNSGWRNEGLPSRDASGRTRLSNPPLALDLHYLLSAYSAEELHGEILLGHAMHLFHENPVLTRDAIRTSLNPSPSVGTTLPPALSALADCGLADQVEQIKITPASLSSEEISKLWSAFQTHYRPTAAYLATVVLIESAKPARAPLPVLSRGAVDPATKRDRGVVVEPNLVPPLPVIEGVAPDAGQPAARLGETVSLTGHHLDGSGRTVRLTNARYRIDTEVAADTVGGYDRVQFTVPNSPTDMPVGFYAVSVRLVRPGEMKSRTTNSLPLVISPQITTTFPLSITRDSSNTATINLECTPEVRPGQRASLLLGEREVFSEPITTATPTLTFDVVDAPIGTFLVRLRVDGIDSPIINFLDSPPTFLNRQVVIS